MIRAVIDTKVVGSAMISPAGNEALLIMAINQGLVAPCLSRDIMEEYSDVLLRPRFRFPQGHVNDMLNLHRHHGHLLDPAPIARTSPIRTTTSSSLALWRGKPDFLVPGNKPHFPPLHPAKATVVNAGELEIITLEL